MYPMHTRKSRQWWLLLGLAALWLLGSAAGATAQTAVPHEPMTPAATGPQSPPGDQAVAALDTYQGTPVGFTADGQPFRGNPNAPLTLVEYSDYLCPFCELYFRQTLPALLEKHIHMGQVQFVLHDLPLASLHPTAPRGATAAMCVAEQGATRFWQMHDALFQAQQE